MACREAVSSEVGEESEMALLYLSIHVVSQCGSSKTAMEEAEITEIVVRCRAGIR